MMQFVIAAPRSGSGKTTVTCALLAALKKRGMDPCAFKSGPDYIDPMFHRSVLGVESHNLDLYLSAKNTVRELYAHYAAGHGAVVCEGAMGFYDGQGLTTRASAWELADALDLPVLLVVQPKGASVTLAAEIQGLVHFKPESHIAGILLNDCSEKLFRMLKPLLETETGLPVLGYLPRLPQAVVESRHLGLKTAGEITDLAQKIGLLADALTEKKDEAAHVYGTAGAERYTCSVCKYVSETRKKEAEAADKKNTESKPVKVKRTEAKDAALNSKFNVKAGKTVKVTWGKVKDADGYDVYMAYCGKDKEKVVKSVKAADSLSVEISKLKKKGINQKKNIKCHVLAYKMVDGKKVTVAKSITIHAAGKKNKSVTDAKSIKLKKTSYVLAKGKKAVVKASIVKKNKKRPIINHISEFRYATSDSKVAVVSKNGKITAKGKGSCSIYVYATNGCAQKIKVVVK